MDAADAWLDALEKRRARKEREFQEGKIADQIVKTAPEVLEKMGMPQEEWQLLAPKEKALRVTGVIQADGYKRAQMDMEKMGVDITGGRMQNQEMGGRLESLERFGKTVEGYENTPELIRKPRREMLEGEVLKLHPADAVNYSRSIENLGRDFKPGAAQPIHNTDYMLQMVGPNSYTTIPNQAATRQRTAVKATAPAGKGSGWIFSEDAEAFREKLLEIEDADTRDAVIDARRAFNLANGKKEESEMVQILKQLQTGKPAEKKVEPGAKPSVKWDSKNKKIVN